MARGKKIVNWRSVNPSVGPAFYRGYLGEWHVMTISLSMTDQGKYTLTTNLPGLPKYVDIAFPNLDDAKIYADNTASFWLRRTGVVHND